MCPKFKLLLILISIVNNLSAQADFRSGFIISHNNDTIRGQLDYRSNARNYKSCVFKNQEGESEYFPTEILGFGYDNDKFFSSQVLNRTFVEVLVLGDLSLFKSKDKFHLKNDTNIFDLESIIEVVKEGSKLIKREKGHWQGITAYLINDCLSNTNNLASVLELTEKSLTKLIVKYNLCRGTKFIEFKTRKPWIHFELGATAGLTRSLLKTEDQLGSFTYLDSEYDALVPRIGAQMTISSPRITEDFAFQSELHYSKTSFSSLVKTVGRQTHYHDTFIDFATLSIPLSLKYMFPERKYTLHLMAGINYDYHFTAETRLLSERVSGSVVDTFAERPAFQIKKNQIGYLGGLGIHRTFGGFNAIIVVRYFEMQNLSATNGFIARNSRLSINFTISNT